MTHSGLLSTIVSNRHHDSIPKRKRVNREYSKSSNQSKGSSFKRKTKNGRRRKVAKGKSNHNNLISKFEPVLKLKDEINLEIKEIDIMRKRNRSKIDRKAKRERSNFEKNSDSRSHRKQINSMEFRLPFSPNKQNFYSSKFNITYLFIQSEYHFFIYMLIMISRYMSFCIYFRAYKFK